MRSLVSRTCQCPPNVTGALHAPRSQLRPTEPCHALPCRCLPVAVCRRVSQATRGSRLAPCASSFRQQLLPGAPSSPEASMVGMQHSVSARTAVRACSSRTAVRVHATAEMKLWYFDAVRGGEDRRSSMGRFADAIALA